MNETKRTLHPDQGPADGSRPAEGSRERSRNHPRTTTSSILNEMSSVTTRNSVYVFSTALFIIAAAAALLVGRLLFGALNTYIVIAACVVALLACATVRVAPQWERVVVLRLGKYSRTVGPGIYATIPVIEHVAAHVDQRVMTTTFYAEEALTEDLVPVDVDAVLFWVVWDPTKACLEAQNYAQAVVRSAQTALRDAIGCIELQDLSHRRKQLDSDLQNLLDEKCTAWGISVSSVEIRNIFIPRELQNALSREAQAKREREARIALAEAERDVSEIYVEAADVYAKNALAVQIRSMNLVNESVKEKGGMVVVPSAYSEGFGPTESFPVPGK